MLYTKRTTRRGVFETNSSSTHSITYDPARRIENTRGKFGNLTGKKLSLSLGYYGWEQCRYTTEIEKAEYAATWARNYGNAIHEHMLKEVIVEETGATHIEFTEEDRSGIDHQSINVMEPYFSSKQILKAFIFSESYVLITDNDNH